MTQKHNSAHNIARNAGTTKRACYVGAAKASHHSSSPSARGTVPHLLLLLVLLLISLDECLHLFILLLLLLVTLQLLILNLLTVKHLQGSTWQSGRGGL